MKKTLPLIAVALVAFYGLTKLFSSGNQWPLTVEAEDAATLVAFGDSLTHGAGAAQNESYPTWLETMSGTKVVNLGRNGDTTASSLDRMDEVLRLKPDIVLVTLGGNDLLTRTPLDQTLGNLRKGFQRLHEAGTMAVYLAIDPPGVGDNWAMAIQHLCKEEGVLYVPNVMKGLWGDSSLMADQIHPNGKGYKIMAERVLTSIRPYIRCTGPAC